MAVIISKKIVVPPPNEKLLSDYAEGDIVKINKNGILTEFYVVKHDYENVLNGTGFTLLCENHEQNDQYDMKVWRRTGTDTYDGCDIDIYLNQDYLNMFDDSIKQLINNTSIYCYDRRKRKPIPLTKKVFLLSCYEFGFTNFNAPKEGSKLSKANLLYLSGFGITEQWTRSPNLGITSAYTIIGNALGARTQNDNNYIRPCFTLQSLTLFDPSTNTIKG